VLTGCTHLHPHPGIHHGRARGGGRDARAAQPPPLHRPAAAADDTAAVAVIEPIAMSM
jgi:hypothetical protein